MNRRLKLFILAGLPALAILAWWLALPTPPSLVLRLFAAGWLLLGLAWLLRTLLRLFLWRVSRRLAFSYFLIGVVPIPLVGCLVAVALYILAGLMLGHLYSDSLESLQSDLQSVAQVELDRLLGQLSDVSFTPAAARFSYYKDGRRFAGDVQAPAVFREFLPRADNGQTLGGVPIFADRDGLPTLFAAAKSGRFAVVARFEGQLDEELRRRMGSWIELTRADSAPYDDGLVIHFRQREFPIEALSPQAPQRQIRDFFALHYEEEENGPRSFWRKPWLVWLELTRPFLDPSTGASADEYVSAALVSSPHALMLNLVPAAPEVNIFVYLVFATVFLVTLNVYVVALIMALTMIFGLSRAVNRLTDATRRVQQGDFSARIEVFRRDQIGALQRSFNRMASNLEKLVDEAAQKEIFERELQIAAEMQHSLLPDTLEAPEPLCFATYFKPCRAIGGDYYDMLPLADGRLAVAVADVAGHGLTAGLRMAMVKSSIELLCQEHGNPRRILERLHELLRYRLQRGHERRAFVTATMAAFDLANRRLEIVGAGHPPTYRLRGGRVKAIELPGPPLGLLPPTLPTAQLDIEPGDLYLWLSDGLIEATDPSGEAFGYERIEETLDGLPGDPEVVRDHLLTAVSKHAEGDAAPASSAAEAADGKQLIDGRQLDDDLTLVVVCWRDEGLPPHETRDHGEAADDEGPEAEESSP